ncbi:hypothetical protein ANCCAN_05908 [Ancylostoma caninum]|uniref:ShKT domain-containing protein n=1 Tax=Ancylostoma caninum TaxID=29170 RepID=A0A368GUP9_ANCCA|nr:hypothetical protein ANCCAN_05908 [Ancylostoma caninum]
MFYFFIFSLLFLNILAQEEVSTYTPCLDKAGSSVCIKPFKKGMCTNEAVKELMQEVCAETCAFCP